jgi:hypothetical protein
MYSQRSKGTKLAEVQHSVESGAKPRQRTFGLRVLRIREDLVDHKPGIGVFFELQLGSVKKALYEPGIEELHEPG